MNEKNLKKRSVLGPWAHKKITAVKFSLEKVNIWTIEAPEI
jgi:hypothetical protein